MVYPRISTSGRNSGFSAFTTTVANNSSKEATKPIKNTSKKTGATEKPKDPPEKYPNLKKDSKVKLQPEQTRDTFIGTIVNMERCKDGYPKFVDVRITNTPNKYHGVKDKVIRFTYKTLKGGKKRIWCWDKVISTINNKHIPAHAEWDITTKAA